MAPDQVEAAFEQALEIVLEHEGGDRMTDDPADPGGATRYGISLRLLRRLDPELGDADQDGDVDRDDIAALDLERVKRIYRVTFWDAYQYDRLVYSGVRVKLFDLAVNMGPSAAHKCVQRGARALGVGLKEDGILGSRTVGALNSFLDREITATLRSEAAGYYRELIARRPGLVRYRRGWLRRAYS